MSNAVDQPLVRVDVRPESRDPAAWYWELPAVAQLREEGPPLSAATVLVGEDGSGRSTLIEAAAHAWRESLTAQVTQWGRRPFAEDARLWHELVLTGERPWNEVDLVQDWAVFFEDPRRLLHHLLDD